MEKREGLTKTRGGLADVVTVNTRTCAASNTSEHPTKASKKGLVTTGLATTGRRKTEEDRDDTPLGDDGQRTLRAPIPLPRRDDVDDDDECPGETSVGGKGVFTIRSPSKTREDGKTRGLRTRRTRRRRARRSQLALKAVEEEEDHEWQLDRTSHGAPLGVFFSL